MIRLESVSKSYRAGSEVKVVAERISAVFPPRTGVVIFGRNGAGKSTLLRMIAGTQAPDSGRILRRGTLSWPVGFAGSFVGDMTGAQNVRFVARIQGVDTGDLLSFVEDFAELGMHYHQPVRTYSSGMRARLAFGISMGIHFDTYLVDEVTATGDATFREKSAAVFRARIARSGLVMVTHSMGLARQVCQIGGVLEAGRLTMYDNVADAIAHHMENQLRFKSAVPVAG